MKKIHKFDGGRLGTILGYFVYEHDAAIVEVYRMTDNCNLMLRNVFYKGDFLEEIQWEEHFPNLIEEEDVVESLEKAALYYLDLLVEDAESLKCIHDLRKKYLIMKLSEFLQEVEKTNPERLI